MTALVSLLAMIPIDCKINPTLVKDLIIICKNKFLKSNVQVCIKPPWCREMLNGPSDVCSKPSMLSNGHLIIERLVTAVDRYGCTYLLCFILAVLS